jgi:hypothetical protein
VDTHTGVLAALGDVLVNESMDKVPAFRGFFGIDLNFVSHGCRSFLT